MELQNLNTPAEIVAAVIDSPASTNPSSNTAVAGGANAGATSPAPGTPSSAARPATYHELKAALPGADATFLTSQLEANATVGQAQSAYMAKLASDNQRMAAENAELKKQQQVAAGGTALRRPGVAPVSNLPAGSASGQNTRQNTVGDAQAAFDEAVREEMTRANCSRHVAHATVCRKQPELREAMVAAHNAAHPDARDPRRRHR